jgi:hypothetical protein
MSRLTQSDFGNRQTEGRHRSRRLSKAMSRAHEEGSIEPELDRTSAKHLTFADDFILEHSHPGLHVGTTGPGTTVFLP